VLFSRLTSITENMTHFPEGETCGSLTRFIAMRSRKVIGRFAISAPAAPCPGAPRPAVPCPKANPLKAAQTDKPASTFIAPVYSGPATDSGWPILSQPHRDRWVTPAHSHVATTPGGHPFRLSRSLAQLLCPIRYPCFRSPS